MIDVEKELVEWAEKLDQMNAQLRESGRRHQQLLADANTVKGVVDYLRMKLSDKQGQVNGSDTTQHDPLAGAESDGGADSPVLDGCGTVGDGPSGGD